ncbi:MAG: FG-GAP repeat domain-containing protein [Thermodesulfobacteriota bacterium]
MKKQVKTTILLVMVALLCSPGCDSHSNKTEAQKKTPGFVFVESSEGLPVSGQWRQDIAIYDVNGDGRLDILAPPPRKAAEGQRHPFLWQGNGEGGWAEAPLSVPPDIPYDYGGIAVSDVDGDGRADIALAIHGKGVRVLRGTGGGEYADDSGGLPSATEFMSRAVVSADMNNDGTSDLVALSEGMGRPRRGVRILYRSDPAWETMPVGSEEERKGLYGDHLAVGDVNGDGRMDVAAGSLNTANSRIVWINDGKGGFTPFNKGLPEEKHYLAVELADLDGDGRDDLIASITGIGRGARRGLRAFLSTPEGFRDMSEGLRSDDIFTAVRACDLNDDGRMEIVGATGKGGLKIFSQKEDRWYEATVSGLPEKGWVKIYNVHCADLNQDGAKDIAVNYGKEQGNSGGIGVFLNRTSPDQ